MKHIESVLGSSSYTRLRFGIGNDFPKGCQVEYVLGKFSSEEEQALVPRIEMACDVLKEFCLSGIQNAMTMYNNK